MPHFPKNSGFTVNNAPGAQKAVTVKNRRKRYLDLHPEYFSAGLELADPLLYDRLIRRFQTTQEREAEGRAKGFSGVLETDLLRSEAKMDAISHPDPNAMMSYTRGPDGEILAEDRDEIPPNKEEGERLWRWEMGLRFMQGNDSDFDYNTVDQNDDYDDHTDEQDQYFEDEEPEWVVDGTQGDDARPNLQGETGIQDF
ncbi:uncharacterized protein N7487_000613 [Penicillium crustosum]|uniref:uncharacterized protein n=1 Tax=Penicillium crustosum TaxID=36656 RepID=UPI0023902061|nr:uncharacterized protein N7487_000613 [Penicillium crustosum]KAJ5417063.1 hypothetical protein N7487_000613 [Penicillium crustosum]